MEMLGIKMLMETKEQPEIESVSYLSLLEFFYFQLKTIYEKFNFKLIVLIIFSVFRRSAENTLRQQELNTWVSSVGKRLHDVEWMRDFFKHQAVLID